MFQALVTARERKMVAVVLQRWVMDSVNDRELRSLCKSVSEEQDPARMRVLLDRLLQILDERQLLASLL